jgi:two-component system, LytTR family, sensor histidine kinase AlgZ
MGDGFCAWHPIEAAGLEHSAQPMKSINQTGRGLRLPNFCNLGVMLRTLVAANLLFVLITLARVNDIQGFAEVVLPIAALAEPALILVLVLLCAARPLLQRMPYGAAIAAVLALGGVLGYSASWVAALALPLVLPPDPIRLALLFMLVAGILLLYFDLYARALSPALGEARLQALQARIRPHFLYNSLNAVLSLIRTEPRRAEHALTDLADLFRVLMADNASVVPLSREIELTRQYLAIEGIRLADRLTVNWEVAPQCLDALVPPLVLQPLVENAVYHGIEPAATPGVLLIQCSRRGKLIELIVENPLPESPRVSAGNRMATANIRERLALHFDVEANMRVTTTATHYRITIAFPYNRESPRDRQPHSQSADR